jgi:hypothetical protein
VIAGRSRELSILVVAVSIVGLAALMAGCAGRSNRPYPSLGYPSLGFVDGRSDDQWWLGGKADLLYPRQWYFVGVGTCGREVGDAERMDCAISRALGQAVAMVRQDVRVDIRRHTEFDRQSGPGGFEAKVRSTHRSDGIGQSELSVDDVAPRRRTCTSEGQCHALVALDRRVLAARSLKKIGQMQKQINELLDRAQESDTLTAIEQLSKAARLSASVDLEAELLAAVAGPNAVPRSASDRLSAVRSKRLESVAVCLSSSLPDTPAQLVFARAHQDLSTRGFARVAIAKEPDCPEGSLSVTFQGEVLERIAEYQLWVFEFRGMVALREGPRTLGKGVPVLGRGVARVREHARSDAEEDLATNVQQSLARLLDPSDGSAP